MTLSCCNLISSYRILLSVHVSTFKLRLELASGLVTTYRKVSSPVLLVSAQEGVWLSRHSVPVPSTRYVLHAKQTYKQSVDENCILYKQNRKHIEAQTNAIS